MKYFTISKAKPKEFPKIYILLKQLRPLKKYSEEVLQKIFLEGLETPREVYIVGKLNDKIIGFASFRYEWLFHDQCKIAYITDLIINEKFQNKGYGSKFLTEIINIAKENSCKEIELSSAFYRVKSHKFYKSKGFKRSYFFFKKI